MSGYNTLQFSYGHYGKIRIANINFPYLLT
jgi:hypothetical protein